MSNIETLRAKRARTLATLETGMRERLPVARALDRVAAELENLQRQRAYLAGLDPRRNPEEGIAALDEVLHEREAHHADLSGQLAAIDDNQSRAEDEFNTVQAALDAAASRH